jgi:arsenate reductase (glutaredoxin)
LKYPSNSEKLQKILAQLGLAQRVLMGKKDDIYAECELDNPSLTDAELIGFMVNHSSFFE